MLHLYSISIIPGNAHGATQIELSGLLYSAREALCCAGVESPSAKLSNLQVQDHLPHGLVIMKFNSFDSPGQQDPEVGSVLLTRRDETRPNGGNICHP